MTPDTEFTPAEVFPPSEYIEEEMNARGWSVEDLARRMGGNYGVTVLSLQLLFAVQDTHLMLGEKTAKGLARAFGTSEALWTNLDAQWRRYGPPSKYATPH